MQRIDLKSGGYVMVKTSFDRKTMREYRLEFDKKSTTEPMKDENGQLVLDDDGIPKKKKIYDPLQTEIAFDIMIKNMVMEAYKPCENTSDFEKIELNDSYFDSMDIEDWEKILDYCLSLIKKEDKEKKS